MQTAAKVAAENITAEAVIANEGFGLFSLRAPGRPGSDLLSHALGHSTIGPGGLNFRVRDGIGWNPSGKATGNRETGFGAHPTAGAYEYR